MENLKNLRVAVIATDGVEESELTEPVKALREAGAEVTILSLKPGEIDAFHHHDKSIRIKIDQPISRVRPDSFDGLLLPGGALNADALRMDRDVQRFIREMNESGRPLAVICHAPWELISAGIIRGRRLTSYHTIQDDVRNAGAEWIDSETVLDGNWVTSRQPSDIPAFNRAMIDLFSKARRRSGAGGQSAA